MIIGIYFYRFCLLAVGFNSPHMFVMAFAKLSPRKAVAKLLDQERALATQEVTWLDGSNC